MNQWHEPLEIAGSISLGDEDDAIIWQYNSSEFIHFNHFMP
jgi:hypothetical protein